MSQDTTAIRVVISGPNAANIRTVADMFNINHNAAAQLLLSIADHRPVRELWELRLSDISTSTEETASTAQSNKSEDSLKQEMPAPSIEPTAR